MKPVNTLIKMGLFSLVIASACVSEIYPRHRAHFMQDFWDEFDLITSDHMRKMEDSYKKLLEDWQQKFDDVDQITLPTVKTDISQDDNYVIIKFTFEQGKEEKAKELINKSNIDVHIINNMLKVLVPFINGKAEMVIDHDMMRLMKTAEIKKDRSADKQNEQIVSYSSSAVMSALPANVDINEARAQEIKATVKDNTLTLMLPKKKVAKVHVTVADTVQAPQAVAVGAVQK